MIDDNGDNIAPKSISLGRYTGDRATTDGTDEYGNAGDRINDNGDNIALESISLGRYAGDRATTDGTNEHG